LHSLVDFGGVETDRGAHFSAMRNARPKEVANFDRAQGIGLRQTPGFQGVQFERRVFHRSPRKLKFEGIPVIDPVKCTKPDRIYGLSLRGEITVIARFNWLVL